MSDTASNADELALIQALNHLKDYQFEADLVDGAAPMELDHTPQTYFSFDIGEHHFAVSATSFCEVLTDIKIAAIPNAPTQLAGLCSLRGVLVPVFQLHHSLDAPLPRKNIIFCIGKGENTLGLLVDALPTSINLRPYEQLHETAQEHEFIKFVSQSAYFSKGRVLHLIEGLGLGEKLLGLTSEFTRTSLESVRDIPAEFH